MGVWETTRGELATASDREFERRVLPLLHVFHPGMIQPPQLQHLDRSGIDLVVWSDGPKFPWVVQCKGFKEKEIGPSQMGQMLLSIEKFRKSRYSCERYVLLHNRTSQNSEARSEVEAALLRLVEEGRATEAWLWDRQTFIKNVKERLAASVLSRISEDAALYASMQSSLFLYGSAYVPCVPVSSRILTIDRGALGRLEEGKKVGSGDSIVGLLMSPAVSRWTLLTGPFGTGKTTAVLRVTRELGRDAIYVRAEDMSDSGGGIGTNLLLARIVTAAHLFNDLEDASRPIVDRLAGETLARILRSQDTNLTLIIDGLDENRIYYRLDGIRRLTNELAELSCPVILTTRQEHFDAMFSNFEKSFVDMSRKGGLGRIGRIFNFDKWSDGEVKQLLAGAREMSTPAQSENLAQFAAALENGRADRLYGDLLRHPLFLQMILEEAAEGRIGRRSRAELVRDWIERKIQRDIDVDRPTPVEVADLGTFVEAVMVLHERLANIMTVAGDDGTYSLAEQIASIDVERVASDVFQRGRIDIAEVLGCSLLTPVSHRVRGAMQLRFCLRVCHEFFLAAHLHRSRTVPDGYPDIVSELWAELGRPSQG
jgi:hypothetical protein